MEHKFIKSSLAASIFVINIFNPFFIVHVMPPNPRDKENTLMQKNDYKLSTPNVSLFSESALTQNSRVDKGVTELRDQYGSVKLSAMITVCECGSFFLCSINQTRNHVTLK